VGLGFLGKSKGYIWVDFSVRDLRDMISLSVFHDLLSFFFHYMRACTLAYPSYTLSFFDTQRNIAPGEKDVDSIVVPNKYCGF
jgi:hypothetical protein